MCASEKSLASVAACRESRRSGEPGGIQVGAGVGIPQEVMVSKKNDRGERSLEGIPEAVVVAAQCEVE